jgi:siroheme synthase
VLPTTLGDVVEHARDAHLKSPTLLIVGEVTALALSGAMPAHVAERNEG